MLCGARAEEALPEETAKSIMASLPFQRRPKRETSTLEERKGPSDDTFRTTREYGSEENASIADSFLVVLRMS